MKKLLLIAFVGMASLTASAQNRQTTKQWPVKKLVSMDKPHAVIQGEAFNNLGPVQTVPQSVVNTPSVTRVLAPTITESLIGETIYDLQSNRSAPRRITNNGNGTYSAIWTTTAPGGTIGNDRGTGYNYYNGTSWITPLVNTRIEPFRTGFGSLQTSNGVEYVASHTSLTPRISIAQRATGSGAWANDTVGTYNSFANQADTWARHAVGGSNGTTVHVIAQGKGVTPSVYPLGMDGPLTYSRSLDGGQTWDIDHIQLPSCTSTDFLGFPAESYHIDARGDVVAIVAGGLDTDLALWKSTDNGSTWNRTTIFAFPMGPLYNDTNTTGGPNIIDIDGDGLNDTIVVPSSDPTVSIDGNGMAHVAVGGNLILDDDDIGFVGIFFVDLGILYWNESLPTWSSDFSQPNYIENAAVAASIDYSGNGLIDVPDVATGQIPYGGYGTYNQSCQPSIGFDVDNNVYIAYAAINETADTTVFPAAHRHIYVVRSGAGGTNFGEPVNIMPDPIQGNGVGEYLEGVWPSIARDVEGSGSAACAMVVYQQDDAPYYSSFGAALSTTAWVATQQAWNADVNNSPKTSNIVVTRVCDIPTGIKNINTNVSGLSVSPNPAHGLVNIQISLTKSEEMTFTLTDVVGRLVMNNDLGKLNSGLNNKQINVAGLNAGVYIYSVKSVSGIKSGKLVVE